MEKDLASEELDRRLSFFGDKERPYGWSFHKAKITKTMLSIENGSGREFYFKKRNFIGEGLEIGIRWEEKTYKLCSLGHRHEDSKIEKHVDHGTLRWEHVEQFVEWIQQGTWSESSGKTPSYINTMKSCFDFLESIEKLESSKLFVSEIRKLKAKLDKHLRG